MSFTLNPQNCKKFLYKSSTVVFIKPRRINQKLESQTPETEILCWTWNFGMMSIYAAFDTNGFILYKLIHVTKVNVNDECLIFYIFWL